MKKDCSEYWFDSLDGENCMAWLALKLLGK